MSDVSPVAILYGPNGQPVAWQTGANTTNDASRSMLLTGGLDGNTARAMNMDSASRLKIADVNPEGDSWSVGYNGRLRAGVDNMLLSELFSGSVVNTNLWVPSIGSLIPAVSNGELNLNSTSLTSSSQFSNYSTRMCPEFFGEFGLYMRFRAKIAWRTNAIFEMGQMKVPLSAAAPTDGVFFRVSATGTVSVVINFNGTETVTTSAGALDVTKWYDFQLEVMSHYVKWQVVDTSGAVFFTDVVSAVSGPLYPPATQASLFRVAGEQHLPVLLRQRHVGAVSPSAASLTASAVTISQRDMGVIRNSAEMAASTGRGGHQGPLATSLAALAQTANHANSVSPADATLSNTAASYTTLGGRYSIASRAGAATDFALFVYQVPVGWRFVITGITITAMNTGATVATTPTILDWSLAVGSSNVSLATTDGLFPTTYSPRRIPLGMQGFKVGDLSGVSAQDIIRSFPTPIICESFGDALGGYIHIIVQVPFGTATASQKIRGDVMINGHFE